jgi:putative Mg2+ transporter-C (MgtC) family protein
VRARNKSNTMAIGIDSAMFHQDHVDMAIRLVLAVAVGASIGLERTFRGRPAGFRTHAIVCLSTALLMLVTVYQSSWFPDSGNSQATIDPTRMAQGIMTGIGFLGAGTIMKDGLSVQGLTTAASIWITAAIGILIGIGFYLPALLCTALTLGALSTFRWLEERVPVQLMAHLMLRFAQDSRMTEVQLRALLHQLGFTISRFTYRSNNEQAYFQYRLVIHTRDEHRMGALAETLQGLGSLSEFSISPTGD